VLGDRVDGRRRGGASSRRRFARTAQPEAAAELKCTLLAHEDDLGSPAGGEAGGDEVGAFYQEGAFTLAELALAQRRRSFDEGVLGAAEWFA